MENYDKSNYSKCNYGKCNHYGKCNLWQVWLMSNVTYGKCYLWQKYYVKCNYGKNIMANETEPLWGTLNRNSTSWGIFFVVTLSLTFISLNFFFKSCSFSDIKFYFVGLQGCINVSLENQVFLFSQCPFLELYIILKLLKMAPLFVKRVKPSLSA